MRKKKIRFILFTMLFLGVFLASCDEIGKIAADVLFTDQDDITLGQQVVAQINSKPAEYPIWTGANATQVKSYLNTVVLASLLQSPAITKKNIYKYNIDIIKDSTVLNAFALPGGPIYVYTGLLKYLDNEAALAGVLGHEIAHAERRHAVQNMAAQYGLQVLANIVLGENPNALLQIGANLLTGALLLRNSREYEDESDEFSFKYLNGSRYYPGSVKFFFEQMQASGFIKGQASKAEIFFSTHPDPYIRIDSTNARLSRAGIPVLPYSDNGAAYNNFYKNDYITNIKSKLP